MRFRLNFSEPPLTAGKRKRTVRLSGAVYGLICVVSLVLLFQTYRSRLFVVDVLENRMSLLEQRIGDLEPRILFLANKSAERNRLRSQISLLAQENSRPSVWFARLADIARRLPKNVLLSEISFMPSGGGGALDPEVVLSGSILLKGRTSDSSALDNLRVSLLESLPMTFVYSRLQVESNDFIADGGNTKIAFTLGFYR